MLWKKVDGGWLVVDKGVRNTPSSIENHGGDNLWRGELRSDLARLDNIGAIET
jgi:hypothetical protein